MTIKSKSQSSPCPKLHPNLQPVLVTTQTRQAVGKDGLETSKQRAIVTTTAAPLFQSLEAKLGAMEDRVVRRVKEALQASRKG